MNRLTETKRNFSGRMHQDDTSLLVSNHSPHKSSDANEANVRIFIDNTMNQLLVLQMCTQFKLCVMYINTIFMATSQDNGHLQHIHYLTC